MARIARRAHNQFHDRPDLTPPPVLLVDAAEAARRLRVSRRKLFDLTRSGEIACVRIGRLVRYAAEYLERWVKDRTGASNNGGRAVKTQGSRP